jgi:dienelactone hydrolase
VAWLWYAASFGVVGFVFSLIPGCLLVSSGVATLLYGGDVRIPQFAALGGLLGVPFAVPALFVAGPGAGLLLIALSAASFVSAGALSVRQEPHIDEVPDPTPTLRLAAETAADDLLLSTVTMTLPSISTEDTRRIQRETHEALALFRDRGWLEKPQSYHRSPPAPDGPSFRPSRVRGLDFEHMRFESGWEPDPEEPGRVRWLSYSANRRAHAWVLRHTDASRPWMVCIHGFQLGFPAVDMGAFRAGWLHHKLGLNVVLPVLPLHGPRKAGRRSGDGFLVGDFMQTIHAEAQAMWDIRSILSWIRAQGGRRIGVHGLSLGGYNTALLACLDDELAFAMPGIPLTDVTRAVWRHGPNQYIRVFEHVGLGYDDVHAVLRVISPLALEPKVPKERRYLYGAVADRLVPPDQVRDLWRHWDRPRIVWYQGGHVTFRAHDSVDRLVRSALCESGFASARQLGLDA